MAFIQSKRKRLRAGLYEVSRSGETWWVEERHDGQRWIWRVTAMDVFHCAWREDYASLHAAVAAIEEGML